MEQHPHQNLNQNARQNGNQDLTQNPLPNNGRSLSELLQKAIPNTSSHTRLTEAQSAQNAWYKIAGKAERMHTTGIFVFTHETNELPKLGVYIDASPMLADFQIQKETYMERLEMVGFPVQDIVFRLSRYPKQNPDNTAKERPLPDLSIENYIEKRKLKIIKGGKQKQ